MTEEQKEHNHPTTLACCKMIDTCASIWLVSIEEFIQLLMDSDKMAHMFFWGSFYAMHSELQKFNCLSFCDNCKCVYVEIEGKGRNQETVESFIAFIQDILRDFQYSTHH